MSDLRTAVEGLRAEAVSMAAYMVRGQGVCEKPHRNGEANPHIHFDDRYIARARHLSDVARVALIPEGSVLVRQYSGGVMFDGTTNHAAPEFGRPPLPTEVVESDSQYMAGLLRGRELEHEAIAASGAVLVTEETLAAALISDFGPRIRHEKAVAILARIREAPP